MGRVLFDKEPIGDPNDPQGQKVLTVMAHPHAKPQDGILWIKVDDVRGLPWIDIQIPYGGLTLAGMPADGVADADEMLALLDRACEFEDDWKRRRRVILPKPARVVDEAGNVRMPNGLTTDIAGTVMESPKKAAKA